MEDGSSVKGLCRSQGGTQESSIHVMQTHSRTRWVRSSVRANFGTRRSRRFLCSVYRANATSNSLTISRTTLQLCQAIDSHHVPNITPSTAASPLHRARLFIGVGPPEVIDSSKCVVDVHAAVRVAGGKRTEQSCVTHMLELTCIPMFSRFMAST